MSTKDEARKRILKLRHEIERYRHAYHVEDKSLISDAALDSLKKELFDLEQEFPDLITFDSPTQRVGGKPLPAFRKVRHEKPMLSFSDAFSESDVKDWLARAGRYLKKPLENEALYGELKIDGLAIELAYENGIFAAGATRGDGFVGEDITQNLKTVEAIPLSLLPVAEVEKNLEKFGLKPKSYKLKAPRLVVRGEVFLTKKEFAAINKEQEKKGLKPYANPRNVAAGSVRQLDPKVTASRRLDSFEYDIVSDIGQKTHEEEHLLLRAFGFKTNPHNKLLKNLDDVFTFRNYWEKHRERLDYEIDGVVVIVNENKTFDDAGVVGKAPRAAIAYKFSAREATTVLTDIKVQVGRTGKLTPVAVMRPVSVGGTTITHATLHNEDEIRRLELKIGDTVVVSRAGDVIPQITKVFPGLRTGKEKEFRMPRACPVCGGPVSRQIIGEAGEKGAATVCANRRCPAKNLRAIGHLINAFEIYAIGPKIIERFKDEGLISDASDIFTLKKEDIATLSQFGEKSAENVVRSIEARKNISLAKFIYALGIPHVGEETAILLAQEVSGGKRQASRPKELLGLIEKFSRGKLQEIPDIGPAVAESIYEWFVEGQNKKFIEKLDDAGVRITHQVPKKKSGPLAGKKMVVTGTLESMSRDEAKDAVRKAGGDWVGSVSENTDYVVVGSEPGSKADKAEELGIKTLDEKEFLRLLR